MKLPVFSLELFRKPCAMSIKLDFITGLSVQTFFSTGGKQGVNQFLIKKTTGITKMIHVININTDTI